VRGLAVIVALFAVLAAGCGSGSGEEAGPTTSTPTTSTETAPPEESPGRPPAPEIAGTTLDGEELSLADFRGRAVLVNVWSAW
jgi:cytochrome oxidase Cu insertion factor (SCO1/SenC/PrrC family)